MRPAPPLLALGLCDDEFTAEFFHTDAETS